jgi:hypothetical protein
MKRSGKYKLGVRDYAKGAVLAAASAALFFLQESLDAGVLVFEWKKIGMAAVGGFVAYLIKNFFEGEKQTTT